MSGSPSRRGKRLVAWAALLPMLAVGCGAHRAASVGPTSRPPAIVRPSPGAVSDPSPSHSATTAPIGHVHSLPPSPAAIQPEPPEGAIPGSLVGTQWYRLPTSQKVVALTFDAGANADAVPSILSTLADHGVPGTFFLTGEWVEDYPDLAAEIGASHPVGNHTYTHPDLTTLSDAAVESEIGEAAAAIQAATGHDTHPMFRFPFGASSDHLVNVVNDLGYGAINWTVDTRGWQGTSGGQSVDLVVDRVLEELRPGEIVIMHVGSHPTDHSILDADALPRIIEEIEARGYGFVAIDQFL